MQEIKAQIQFDIDSNGEVSDEEAKVIEMLISPLIPGSLNATDQLGIVPDRVFFVFFY